MYTVISSTVVDTDKGVQLTRRVDILCDTEADLPTAEQIEANKYAVGSCALIADGHITKVLNHKGEWV